MCARPCCKSTGRGKPRYTTVFIVDVSLFPVRRENPAANVLHQVFTGIWLWVALTAPLSY